jgi:hypothetical protein
MTLSEAQAEALAGDPAIQAWVDGFLNSIEEMRAEEWKLWRKGVESAAAFVRQTDQNLADGILARLEVLWADKPWEWVR